MLHKDNRSYIAITGLISGWILLLISLTACTQQVRPGAERTGIYFPLLKGKKIAIVANQTSLIGKTHLIDSLRRAGIKVMKIFAPEHGLRGDADAGVELISYLDQSTGIPVVSLFGKKVKPSHEDLSDCDEVVFDIQDVGVRFFTYLSTLSYVMEACAEQRKPLLILDRPNPNGFYVDGPVLDMKLKSFVGLHPVPVVYGMTIGEYAMMINGEGWLENGVKCDLIVISCENYDHNWCDELPVKPSPNLPNLRSILLYPSLCLFEGTIMNVGRGTEFPFQVFGHPAFRICEIQYTPRRIPGMSMNPLHLGLKCCAMNLRNFDTSAIIKNKKLILDWLILAYKNIPDTNNFFIPYFELLAGDSLLKARVKSGMSSDNIHKTWEKDLKHFREIRKKYLLYADFKM